MLQTITRVEPDEVYNLAGQSSVGLQPVEAIESIAMDWTQHVKCDNALLRPSDIKYGAADPGLAHSQLGWKAPTDVDRVVAAMYSAASGRLGGTDSKLVERQS